MLIIIGRVHKYIISINSNITSTRNIGWRMVAGHQEVMPRCIGKYRMGGTRSQKWYGVKVLMGLLPVLIIGPCNPYAGSTERRKKPAPNKMAAKPNNCL